jgi:phosphoserine phosphatase
LLNLLFLNFFNLLEVKKTLLKSHYINYDTNFLINPTVFNWIKENKIRFKYVYLVSASPDFFIKYILQDQDIFDDVFGSIDINLKGVEKVKFIQHKWGSNFAYIGDSNDDIPIFKVAKESYRIINNNNIINVKTIYQAN